MHSLIIRQPTQNLASDPAKFFTLFSDFNLPCLTLASELLPLSRLSLVELPPLLSLDVTGVDLTVTSGSATQETLRELIELGNLGLDSNEDSLDRGGAGEYCASSQKMVCARAATGRTVEGADPGIRSCSGVVGRGRGKESPVDIRRPDLGDV